MSKKPTDNKPLPQEEPRPPKPKFDPFAHPSPELLVANVPAPGDHTHALVLNKYPVIPNHLIIATRADKPQTDLLEPNDLAMTYACLRAWRADSSEPESADSDLLAFFNSGPHSGASQPHRHLQFLPVSDMHLGLTDSSAAAWQPLIQSISTRSHISQPYQLYHNPRSPFLALSTSLAPTMKSSELFDRYVTLLRAAFLLTQGSAMDLTAEDLASTEVTEPQSPKHVSFSYNLALTSERIAIAPRRSESAPISGLKDSEVALNGTILGGTLMVKERAEWDKLREGPEVLEHVLGAIGYPSLKDEGVRL